MREQPELRVEEVPVADLVPYVRNAKRHDDAQVRTIANSIREFGNCDPVAVWTNAKGEPEIVEGHGRVLALKQLGIETAPVIHLDHLTDEQRRAYTHVHNQTTLNSGFDPDLLEADMFELDFDWEGFGFTENFEEGDEKAGGFDPDGYHEKLTERYSQNPFSVLDTSAADWVKRKREWAELIDDDKVRGDACLFGGGLLFDERP